VGWVCDGERDLWEALGGSLESGVYRVKNFRLTGQLTVRCSEDWAGLIFGSGMGGWGVFGEIQYHDLIL
jgi:hypothetical protein